MSKERKTTRINGTRYYLTIVETDIKKRVSVYPPEVDKHKHKRNRNDIVFDRRWRGRILWFGKDTTPPISTIVQEALNKAVCIYEEKQEKEKEYKESIENAIDNVAEAHE